MHIMSYYTTVVSKLEEHIQHPGIYCGRTAEQENWMFASGGIFAQQYYSD